MSKLDILNPTVDSELSPDYAYTEGLPQMLSQFQAKSGSVIARQLFARGRVYDLTWAGRLKTTADQLRQWEAQFRNDFFTFFDNERGRSFSGRFSGPLQISPSGYNRWDIHGQFIEIPGVPMYGYPVNWSGGFTSNDAIFLEERDGFGKDLVKLTGSGWTYEVTGSAHGGSNYYTNVTNDTAEWVYYGYGVQFWVRKQNNLGIMEHFIDGVSMGNLDLYSAGALASAVLASYGSYSLGFHRVKVRCTGTKNAASSGFFIYADAIEVMQ
jgi:hypothetical protein